MAQPTTYRGTIHSKTDTQNERVNLSEAIDFLSPLETPLLTVIGQDSLHFPCDQIKHEWLEDELRPRETTLAANYTNGSGVLTVQSAARTYFFVDDLLRIGTNVLRILAGPPDSNVFVVQGGIGGTTDASASSGSVVRKISHAAPEGGVARVDATKTALARPYNVTQIFKDWTTLTGTMEVLKRYGYVSERAYQEEKVLRQLAIDMEYTLIYGVRSWDDGPPRHSTLGGLAHYVLNAGISGSWDTVYNAQDNILTEAMLGNLLQAIWEQGGMPNVLVVNGFNQRVITSWATPRIRTEIREEWAGAHIGQYLSDFGTLDIILNRWLIPTDVLVLTTSEIGIGPLEGRAFGSKVIPSLGDYTQTEVLGEYTMEVHKPAHCHGWIYNTANTW